ncbi:MAG: chitobiase/beta-hexosaminidase C-terminal domain-containing protein [Muribaculaceae bacterium]|nr:chitobiase/beta-hexosaminidase C-terminal domain-containing protein [Muribaculaceae bacterium]
MRIHLSKIFRIMLPLLALLIGSATARAQDEEGVKYTLTTRCIPEDASTNFPSVSEYSADASVSLRASGKTGFQFLQWEDEDGNIVSESSRFTYTMPAQDVTLIAHFEYNPDSPAEPTIPEIEIKTYATIQVDWTPMEGGSVSVSGAEEKINDNEWKFEVGTNARISASSRTGFRFVNWTEDGEEISTSSSLSFTVEEGGRSIVANFVYDPSNPSEPGEPKFYRMLALKANPAEAARSLSGAGEHINGTSVDVSASANSYYIFDNWTDDAGNVVSDTQSFSYTMPNKHTTLTANFHYDFNPASPDEPGSPAIDDNGIVGKPRMTMKDKTHVMIMCTTPGATIHYTLDGSTPTTASDVYTEAVFVPGNIVVKAIAVKEGMTDSDVTTYQVTSYRAAMPVITFENQKIKISTTTENATIHYTVDNSDPTADSPVYTAPLDPEDDLLIKAIACRDDLTDSDIAAFVFDRDNYIIEAPVITPQEDGSLLIIASVEGGETRYTIDGTDPTSTSTLYTEPLKLDGNFTVKAYTTHPNYYDSPISEYVQEGFVVETPTCEYADLTLTLATATPGAEIRYTLDESDPTEESTLYTAPLALTEDCKVTARGFKANYEPSDTVSYTFVYVEHQVAAPVVTYDPEALTITMACDTINAQIRYTIDGEAPTAETETLYEGPVAVVGNHTYTARAFRADLFPSEPASVTVDNLKVPTPTSSYAAKQLTLSCADAEATIHYTTDGTNPTAASTAYTGPLTMSADCSVKFIAVREFFLDSEIGSFEFKVADHQVAKPAVSHSVETLKATMTTATEGATIRYTTDGTVPTASTGTLYSAPVDLNGNVTFTVRAFHPDMFDSEVTVYEIADLKLPMPTAAYGKHALTLACEDPTAQIRYTTDGTAPTAESTLYSAPIPLTADCTVRFIAAKTGFVSSDEGSYRFVLADWQEAMPTITKDFAERKITINQANSLPVNVNIDGTVQSLPTPATLDVTPEMTAVSAVAVAQDENRYDSPVMTDEIVFHKAPAITYDGHTLRVALADGEPAATAAERQLFIDGKLAANGTADLSTDINAFCNVTARVQSENAFISDMAEMRIDVYNTGRVAAARNGHRLAEAFGTWGDKADSYEYLRLGGELSRADIDVVAALPQLSTLHIEVDSLAAEDYAGALAGTRIETIFSNEYPEGMLTGMPRLTTLMWGRTDRAIPDGRVTEAGNPNLLFWTPDFDMLPEDSYNTVIYDYAPDGVPTDPEGTGVSGRAETIHLFDGCPFRAHMPLTTGSVDFKKIFRLPTEIDICAGWETLVLPFTAETISHERQGAIVPFAAWDGQNDPYGGIKPFWLYSSNEDGWEETDSIKAGVPYIISMPNNKEYVESSNLDGEVTFLATGEILLGTPESAPKTTSWKAGAEFTGTFMPVEEEGILSMNVNATDGEYAGSAFTADAVTLPFGAYVWAPGEPQAIPVFPDGSGVNLPTVSTDGSVTVETPAPGMLRISSSRALHSAIFTPEGATVRVIDLQAGETLEVDGLTRGLYIVAGVKVMVK